MGEWEEFLPCSVLLNLRSPKVRLLFTDLGFIFFFLYVVILLDQEWLKPYAAFCFLRDFFETSDHSQWGRLSQFSESKVLLLSGLISLCVCWES